MPTAWVWELIDHSRYSYCVVVAPRVPKPADVAIRISLSA